MEFDNTNHKMIHILQGRNAGMDDEDIAKGMGIKKQTLHNFVHNFKKDNPHMTQSILLSSMNVGDEFCGTHQSVNCQAPHNPPAQTMTGYKTSDGTSDDSGGWQWVPTMPSPTTPMPGEMPMFPGQVPYDPSQIPFTLTGMLCTKLHKLDELSYDDLIERLEGVDLPFKELFMRRCEKKPKRDRYIVEMTIGFIKALYG